MQKEFRIEGMSCGHCVGAVEKELNKLNLKSLEVRIGLVKVEVDSSVISEEQIISTIKEAGYNVVEETEK